MVSRQAVGEAVADVVRAVANGRVVDQRVEMAEARACGESTRKVATGREEQGGANLTKPPLLLT